MSRSGPTGAAGTVRSALAAWIGRFGDRWSLPGLGGAKHSSRQAVVSAAGLAPLQFGGIDIFGAFQDAVRWYLEAVVGAVLSALDIVFSAGFEWFLFFRNPLHVDALNSTWETCFGLYLAVVLVATFGQLLTMELRPGPEKASVQRWIRRVLVGFTTVLISREFIGFAVSLTNAFAGAFYQYPFQLRWGVELVGQMVDSGSVFFAIWLVPSVVTVLAVVGLALVFVLAIRMYLVYMVYALFPLLMAFWVVDIGPAKHAQGLAKRTFTVTAYLLLSGILITAILTIGVAIADFGGTASVGGSLAGPSVASGGTSAAVDAGEFESALVDLVRFLGTVGTAAAVAVLAVYKGAT